MGGAIDPTNHKHKSRHMARRASKPEAATKPNGRPRLYKSAEDFASKVEDYFTECEAKDRKPSLTGLCVFMDFCDKESFSNYENYGEEFSRTVKKTRLRIEENRIQLLTDKASFTPGIIFDLKNNHGWVDKQEVEHSGQIGLMDRINRGRSRS